MKKNICILIGILTFSVGFWIHQLNAINSATQLSERIEMNQSFSLCEIAENPKSYQEKQIKVRAFLATGGYYDVFSGLEVTDYKSDCASKIIVNLSNELKQDKSFLDIAYELEKNRSESQKGLKDGWAIAEVEFTGNLTITSKSGISQKHYFVLTPTKIRKIAPISFIRPNEVSPLNTELVLN